MQKSIELMPDHALGVMTDVNHLKCLSNDNHDLKKKITLENMKIKKATNKKDTINNVN